MIHCSANIFSAILNKLWCHVTSENFFFSININSRGYFLSNNICTCRESPSSSGIICLKICMHICFKKI